MVPKLVAYKNKGGGSFRAVLFRMVPKQLENSKREKVCFRAVLFRMVPKPNLKNSVLNTKF